MQVLFVSLGCDKNLVDSEVMLGILCNKGYQITNEEKDADIIVINTCCFIHDAKEESINTILEMAQLKKSGKVKVLIVTGCLAQRYQEEMQEEIPEVDAILGTTSYEDIANIIDEVLSGKNVIKQIKDINYLPLPNQKRVHTTGSYFSYLKIAEGCDKHCTYCIIPKVRGNYRSVPMDRLIKEAKELVDGGIKELILIAQETTIYGKDLYGEKMLPVLLRELCTIEGIEWIRILYCYPEEITQDLIDIIKQEKKICNYLDMPIQHASDIILKKMGRKTTKKELVRIIEKLRKEIPDIALRTTLITGFPGETQEEHNELLEFVKEMKFERLGVFSYSPEEDTPAAKMDNQIEEQIKQERKAELMQLQQEIAFSNGEKMVGRRIKVMIEGELPGEQVYLGRTYQDAPEVDGYIFVSSSVPLISGDFVSVRVTKAKEYDLIGEMLG